EGEAVNPAQPLFTVVRSDQLELSGEVTIEQAATIRPGQAVIFTLDAYPNREFKGEVSRIEPMANTDTRQVGVYVRMRNPGGLVGGQFATGRIQTKAIKAALVIPEGAVRGQNENTFVLLVKDGRAVKRVIKLGAGDGGTGVVQILSGLQSGDIIITTPGADITEGTRVQVSQ